MRGLFGIGAALVGAALAFGLAVFLASHYGGERVTLRTTDAAGASHTTPLWVVELDGHAWLRAGDRDAGWAARLRAEPEVALRRDGAWRPYRAVPVPERTEAVSARMAEKYGLADRLVGLVRDPAASVAIRLEPRAE